MSDCPPSGAGGPIRVKKKGVKTYNPAWPRTLGLPWLGPAKGGIKSRCNVCQIDMVSRPDTLRDHATGNRHKLRVSLLNSNLKVPSLLVIKKSDKAKRREIRVAVQAVKHSNFSAVEHVTKIVNKVWDMYSAS